MFKYLLLNMSKCNLNVYIDLRKVNFYDIFILLQSGGLTPQKNAKT